VHSIWAARIFYFCINGIMENNPKVVRTPTDSGIVIVISSRASKTSGDLRLHVSRRGGQSYRVSVKRAAPDQAAAKWSQKDANWKRKRGVRRNTNKHTVQGCVTDTKLPHRPSALGPLVSWCERHDSSASAPSLVHYYCTLSKSGRTVFF
jgi:hypothetical protein